MKPFVPELFRFESWYEKLWRARVRKNPKEARAQRSLAEFHAAHPDHVVSLAEYRRRRANLAQMRLSRIRRYS